MDERMKNLINMIQRSQRDGIKFDKIREQFVSFGMEKQLLEDALKIVEEKKRRIRILVDPPDVHKKSESWYNGPKKDDIFWSMFEKILRDKGWKEVTIKSIDDASSKIISFMEPPGMGIFNSRGLVLGYIQSGKTTNYTAVISKAADVGYRLFIVLSGISNSLRQQTQIRLNNDIISLNPEYWLSFTSDTSDFSDIRFNANALLTQKAHQKFLCVVKKNHFILRNLINWINSARKEILRECPVIIIDDEADHASINVADGTERSKINSLIHELLDCLTKRAYIGYTATPFANILIDPTEENSLYPKDFIVSLNKPDDYIGTEEIFGREALTPEEALQNYSGLNIINKIHEADLERTQPSSRDKILEFTPSLGDSMRGAILYFWLACSARYAEEKEIRNYTMLIHTTRYTDPQLKFGLLIENFKDEIQSKIKVNDDALKEELKSLWNTQKSKLTTVSYPKFDHIYNDFEFIIENTVICVQNSRTDDDILNEYANNPGPFIIIGGDTLSRGLTLEGLIVSYFSRITKNYDTLLQMGRWFGYHKEYLNLVRIWMRDEYFDYFRHLATVEQEIRNDIYRYEQYDITPADLAVRIQTHPSLNVTSHLKMRNAMIAKSSFSGKMIQTRYYKHKNPSWLEKNIVATKNLISNIQESGIKYKKILGRYFFSDVDVSYIKKFFEEYQIHEKSRENKTSLILNYLDEEIESHKIWNVIVMGIQHNLHGLPIDLGLDENVNLRNRSKSAPVNSTYANIRSLGSKEELLIDILKEGDKSYKLSDIKDLKEVKEQEKINFIIKEFRELKKPNIGLLLIYPIYRLSTPQKDDESNMFPLDADEDVIGINAYFPRNESEDIRRKYISANLESEI